MKVLLAVDGSEYTKRMLAYLAAHEELLGQGNLFTALNVTLAIPSRVAQFVDKATVDNYCEDEAEAVFKPIRAFAQQQHWDFSTAHLQGPAAEAIATYAEETKTDLIIMGTHGYSALGRIIMGSTVSGVLARCEIPVLLVR
ncbi:MAG: UspA protein [Ramlibacter sp.]|jgi:nucleotide-binding universal stress UspA family protein|nr:UspA protein [Ramlibacter sp.]MDB5914729.1 UspA protein [Ramlibacter sp.]